MSKDNGIYIIHFKDGLYVKELFAAENIGDPKVLVNAIEPFDRCFTSIEEAKDYAISVDCEKRTEHGVLFFHRYRDLSVNDIRNSVNDANNESKMLSM